MLLVKAVVAQPELASVSRSSLYLGVAYTEQSVGPSAQVGHLEVADEALWFLVMALGDLLDLQTSVPKA